jgi:hypothetical protein
VVATPKLQLMMSAEWIDFLQWPAMLATVLAAWLVASNAKTRRNVGFWVFLVSNVLWAVWGWHDGAYALIALQVALAALNIRGVFKTEQPAS